MARDSSRNGSGKTVLWIVFGIVGCFTFLCAGIVVIWIMSVMSHGTSANTTFGKMGGKPVAKTQAAKQSGVKVGNVALEIEGKDIDDKPFKLSDYRSKVVMLDFWAHW